MRDSVHLLGRDVERLSSHVNLKLVMRDRVVVSTNWRCQEVYGGLLGVVTCLLVHVHTGNDKENSRTSRPSRQQQAQTEDDSSLILLEEIVTDCLQSYWCDIGTNFPTLRLFPALEPHRPERPSQ